jgi:hypothetical protein
VSWKWWFKFTFLSGVTKTLVEGLKHIQQAFASLSATFR